MDKSIVDPIEKLIYSFFLKKAKVKIIISKMKQ
jgi:hypothetical protein